MMGIITAIILWVSGSSFNSNTPQHQHIAQQPTYEFRSTTQRVQPATTWGEQRTYVDPFSADGPSTFSSSPSRPRRVMGDDDDDIDPPPGGGPADPGMDETNPIGDVPWIMMLLLAAGYIVYTARKRQRLCSSEKK